MDLLRRWREDRFVRPSPSDPRVLAAIEARMWQLLPADVEGVELSPVVPLGTCAAVTPQSQDRVVSTVRTAEVLSDSTNALAVEAADRRRRQPAGGEVHLAAGHRMLRAQRFPAGFGSHFRLFALVSSARDTGSGTTQARLLIRHLRFWRSVLPAGAAPRLLYTVFDSPVLRERVEDTVRPAVPVTEQPERGHGRGYYVEAALRIVAGGGEIGDGGFTTWTAQIMGDAKERCLVSCVSTERLAALGAQVP
ncbi:hypothetical protein [Phytohabitans suffuscus]|uniref:Uncharacterized protein n=1 Tax=Phytohabitans suffuscus TaxID=624315 RepID=A0A6F8YD60_9ACTN|nr:hypothetical protein [Phytohabitans suffuscus]BCB83997.1 hypothetical protein Psuf_013100 [Phytohabitans suffuscus]